MERKEAIEVIKKNWPDGSFTILREALETLIPELAESEDEKKRKEIVRFIQMEVEDEMVGNKWIAWLEKKGEEKSADKVEPKFKVGDWVVCEELNTALIVSIDDEKYEVEFIDGNKGFPHIDYIDRMFHLWTIQDAKVGDVLSYVTDEEDLWIMIYWSLYKPYGLVHYHALLVNDNFGDKGTCCICIDDLKPATKEQRDTLFTKMKEAGYTWNEKELKLEK